MKSSPHRSHLRGFSVLELLIGITLALVLAALLGVSLRTVRSKSDQAACLSNLRQIGIATLQYTGERNGVLPGPVWITQAHYYSTGTPYALLYHIAEYLGLPAPTKKDQYSVIFDCPALTRGGQQSDDMRSYSVNSDYFGYPPQPGVKPAFPPKKLSDVAQRKNSSLATTYSLMEVKPADALKAPFSGKPHGGLNYLFFDGHVENRPLQ